jgi:glc operon protein GlcG
MTLRAGFGVSFLLSLAAGIAPAFAQATQAPAPATSAAPTSNYLTPIGATISLEVAKNVAAAASAEAQKNKWLMAIAIVDPAGTLVYYEKADNTQNGSASVAIDKARSAALYKRPTKAFQDAVEKGGVGLRVLRLEGAIPLEGGVPLLVDGKLIGALGVSGDLAENDGKCAAAGAAAVATKAASH